MDLFHLYCNYNESSLKAVLNYANLIEKLHRNKINLHFNRVCKRKNIKPNFIKIAIHNKSSAAQFSKNKCEKIWLSKSIKDLYTKIDWLTLKTYKAQLMLSKLFHPLEYNNIIQQVEKTTERNMMKKRRTISQKLTKLKTTNNTQSDNIDHNSSSIKHKFYKRIHNLTNINLNITETKLLEKGLKYHIEQKYNTKTRNKHLLDIENAILKTNKEHQDDIRALVINEITTKQPIKFKQELSTLNNLKNIKKKLAHNDALITKADKGNTAVIIYKSEYNCKIEEYISNSNISILRNDPTNTYLKTVNKVINKSTSILNKQQIYFNKMIKPTAPTITGLPKLHKPNTPIRPLINFTTSPSYRIAKFLNIWLTQNIKLEDNSSIKNNIELVDKIISIHIPSGAKLASFDVTNMYTNIPIAETLQITENLLTQNQIEAKKVKEAIEILKTIMQQNYFQHDNKFYTQNDGLPMGSPLSGTLANIYLNHFERTHIMNERNKYKNNILYWHRYVDDILIMFKGTHRQIEKLHKYINSIHDNIKFTLEVEINKSINFLDLTIQNVNQKHSFKIYRKDTQTDHTIHSTSNHPAQHKYAAYNHMLHRLNNIPMAYADYNEELNTIIHIATQNGFTSNMIHQQNSKIKHKIQQQYLTTLYTAEDDTKKYITLEYNTNTSYFLKKIFGKYKYTIAYKTGQKLHRRLSSKQNRECDSGIYKLICNDCPRFYIGQTGRNFSQRFTEHIQEIKNGRNTQANIKSNYANHLIAEKHTYTDINTNLQILHKLTKGNTMDRIEEIEIYKHRYNPHILNDKLNTKTNKIYDIILYNG